MPQILRNVGKRILFFDHRGDAPVFRVRFDRLSCDHSRLAFLSSTRITHSVALFTRALAAQWSLKSITTQLCTLDSWRFAGTLARSASSSASESALSFISSSRGAPWALASRNLRRAPVGR